MVSVWLLLRFFFPLYIVSGWAYNFFPESESSRLLFIPSGYWSRNLYVEGQCHSQSGCSLCNIGLELMGCLSFHEFGCESEEKSACTLPCFSYVRLGWFSYHCHWLKFLPFRGSETVIETYMELFWNVMWLLYFFWHGWHTIFEGSLLGKYGIQSLCIKSFSSVLLLSFSPLVLVYDLRA